MFCPGGCPASSPGGQRKYAGGPRAADRGGPWSAARPGAGGGQVRALNAVALAQSEVGLDLLLAALRVAAGTALPDRDACVGEPRERGGISGLASGCGISQAARCGHGFGTVEAEPAARPPSCMMIHGTSLPAAAAPAGCSLVEDGEENWLILLLLLL
ncbi:uncharacterized protein A4U43_C05F3550 [Asparagus officinalis]|uniref:Uncharacterized protein n=1 Tax=Asparagus officinalis TaxID=4686 RepID=A0A5P1EPA8_ASPOF|nr:uncharacterized protein A4U43_C05F3550 [Asparagus officinalis]